MSKFKNLQTNRILVCFWNIQRIRLWGMQRAVALKWCYRPGLLGMHCLLWLSAPPKASSAMPRTWSTVDGTVYCERVQSWSFQQWHCGHRTSRLKSSITMSQGAKCNYFTCPKKVSVCFPISPLEFWFRRMIAEMWCRFTCQGQQECDCAPCLSFIKKGCPSKDEIH